MTKRESFSFKFRVSLAVILAVMSLSMPLRAQLTRGAISGTVRDASGAVIPGAEVKITNRDTNLTRTVVTNDEGFYRAVALEPGHYSVTVEMSGFGKVENNDVEVKTAQETTFNVDLKVAEVVATINVTAQAEGISLNKTNPTIGTVFTGRQATELPLSAGRNINNLALLSPNVFTAPGSTGISANGQRARNNNFTIDGSDNNDISVTLSTTPVFPEAVGEFQVQTNPYNAEFGRNSGAQINVITKSGTNKLRGEAWEYYGGSRLNALDNIEKQNGLTRPARFNRNQFGFDLGGPILKDKTFVFGLVQWDRTRQGASPGPNVRIPTPTGFAALNTVPLRQGQSQGSRQASLGGISFLNDVYKTNPVFRNLQNTMINGVPIQTGLTNVGISSPSNSRNTLLRLDHSLSENDNLTARYIFNQPINLNFVSNTEFGPIFAGDQLIRDQNLALSETHVFSSRTVNEFRFSYVRRNLQFPEHDPKTPATAVGGFFDIGGLSNFPQGRVQNSFQYSDVLSRQFGRHAVKVGVDIRRIQLFNLAAFDSKGTFTFLNLQDFVNNFAFSFVQALQTATFDARQTQQFYFAQDDFHVTSNLTLNLGARYETSGVPFGFFGATDAESLAAGVPGPVKRDKNNWAPRVGFAYAPQGGFWGKGKTVVRGGYGISYDILFYNILTVNASNYPRVVVGRQDQVFDLFPSLTPVTGAPKFDPLAVYVNTPSDARTPYTHLYSLSIQREISRSYILEVGYTGSHALNGINQLQGNPAILTPEQAATVRSTGSVTSIPSTQARRVNPKIGSRVLIATVAQSTYNAGFLDLKKRFSHGLQFGVAYTYSHLLSNNDESLGVGAITNSSPQIPQDFFNYGAEKSTSVFDRTHRFVTNYIYEVPWFKSNWAQLPVVKQVFSGWEVSGVTSRQSGQPFTILTGVDTNGNGAAGDRPNFNPNGQLTLDPVTHNYRTFTSDRTNGVFTVPVNPTTGLPLANSLGNGNLGRNTLRAPKTVNTNFSVQKHFNIIEDHKLIFRADFFNAFNQDDYQRPVNNMNSPDYGKNTQNWGNRAITLGLKYSF
ncbi:MAG TPA: carboxypeptidase regulatory-like domain-containing protein [Acidobacteriota bacterium]|jgi:hypothetical protein